MKPTRLTSRICAITDTEEYHQFREALDEEVLKQFIPLKQYKLNKILCKK